MKLSRRTALHLTMGAAALPALSRFAWAQSYPTRPVRIIVGYARNSSTDFPARLIGQWLSERLGQQFVIENRPGRRSNVAAEAAVRAPADGYTLLALTSTNMINATLDKLSFDLNRDFAMVAGLSRSPFVVEVHPSVPVKTLPELIAYARSNPGKISMASFDVGSLSYLAAQLFKMMTDVSVPLVPYPDLTSMYTDLLRGDVQMAFDWLRNSIEDIRADKLRPLAITTVARSESLPDIPTLADFVPGYEASAIVGIGAPKHTPAEIVNKLNKEINAGLADPKLKAELADLGESALATSPADFTKIIAEDTEKWAKVIKLSGLKLN
jgi:tripartite-type tricarboxylate transporter receptor subunit TctC